MGVYYEKNRSHAETSSAKVSSWSVSPFKRYRRKTGPHEAETDSRHSPVGLIIPGSGSRDPGIALIPNPGIEGFRDFGIPICSHTEMIV